MDKSDEKQEKKSGFRLRLPKFKSVVALEFEAVDKIFGDYSGGIDAGLGATRTAAR